MAHVSRRTGTRIFCTLAAALFVGGKVPVMGQQGQISLRARLTGPAIGGDKPTGSADFDQNQLGSLFKVQVGNVNLSNGTVLTVAVNSGTVGTMQISFRQGSFQSTSVSNLKVGDLVSVLNGPTVVVSGKLKRGP
jgi:hypothetical protein